MTRVDDSCGGCTAMLRDAVRASFPIDRAQLEDLVWFVDGAVQRRRCDHSTRAAQERASAHDVAWAALGEAFAKQGGYCDCEVAMNCNPDELFG